MRSTHQLAPAALLSVLLYAACSSPPVVALQPKESLPPAMWQCQPEPPRPSLGTDADLAGWIVDLAYAGRDCRQKLAGAKAVVEP